MKTIVIDCCEMSLAQQGDSRVKFSHLQLSKSGDSAFTFVRTHCPLSVAMQVIAFNQSVPNGCDDSYTIEPETTDTVGHVEK